MDNSIKSLVLDTISIVGVFFVAAILLCACSTPAPQSEKQPQDQPVSESLLLYETESVADTPEIVVVIDEPAPIVENPSSVASELYSDIPASSSSSYSDYSDDSDDDYWAEKRKHSPNDNYLLGFDEDVDDVHDMEIYMEDY